MTPLLLALALLAAPQTAPALTSGWVGPPESGIFYETAGSGPTMVLIHGGQMDRRIWEPQMAAFAARFRVVRYDVRGYGRSPAPKAPYSDIADLAAVLDAVGADKAHIVGLSLGGRIAIDFALAYPKRVETMILSGPGLSGYTWSPAADARARELNEAIASRDTKRILEAWLSHDYMKPAMARPELAPVLRRLVEENAGAWSIDESLDKDHALRAIDRVQELDPPTLLLVGQLDVPDIQMISRRVASLARLARRMMFPGAGHILNMELPDEFTRAVLAFIDSASEPPAPPRP